MQINSHRRKNSRYEWRITTGSVTENGGISQYFLSLTLIDGSFSDIYKERFRSFSYHIKEAIASNYSLNIKKHILPWFGTQKITEITHNLKG